MSEIKNNNNELNLIKKIMLNMGLFKRTWNTRKKNKITLDFAGYLQISIEYDSSNPESNHRYSLYKIEQKFIHQDLLNLLFKITNEKENIILSKESQNVLNLSSYFYIYISRIGSIEAQLTHTQFYETDTYQNVRIGTGNSEDYIRDIQLIQYLIDLSCFISRLPILEGCPIEPDVKEVIEKIYKENPEEFKLELEIKNLKEINKALQDRIIKIEKQNKLINSSLQDFLKWAGITENQIDKLIGISSHLLDIIKEQN